MKYSLLDYLRDVDSRTKRAFWEIWGLIGVILLISLIAIRIPGGIVPLIIVYVLWLLRDYRIELNEKKRNAKNKKN